MALSTEQGRQLQAQLQKTVTACTERGLYIAAKWAAELLNSFSSSDVDEEDVNENGRNTDARKPPPVQSNLEPREADLENREYSRFLLARSLFECREFDRCAATFLPVFPPPLATSTRQLSPLSLRRSVEIRDAKATSQGKHSPASNPDFAKTLSRKALFLSLYARYLAGEKRRNEDREPILGPSDGAAVANKELTGILSVLESYFESRGGLEDISNSDGWLDYLFGLMLLKSKSEALARQWLLRSLNLNPWNWSAWLELATTADSQEELTQLSQHLPHNIMTFFFDIHCRNELLQQNEDTFHLISKLMGMFPNSAYLQQQKATMHYHAREHDTAAQIFEHLLRNDPHRLEGLEVYSNLLYVMPNRPKLATLASQMSLIDKFRPETNCVLGNYYSLVSEHEKAVLHFRRTLTLDRDFQVAWTLMGHSYIELKNTQAAIESYRRAVDINRKDYRAWYGLGQGYEMLECYSYCLFYYQRAAALCPGDPKMWAAVGNAYSKCNKTTNAIQAYKRALAVGSQIDAISSFGSNVGDPIAHAIGGALDPQTLYDIALLYERDGSLAEAAAYMELTMAQEEGADDGDEGMGVTQITSRARLWLARWSYSCGEWQRTMELANELCQDGVDVEEAKSLVKDVRARLSLMNSADDD